MGTVVEFPVGAAARREGESAYQIPREGSATVVILPVVRIERYTEETRGDSGPKRRDDGAPTQAAGAFLRTIRSVRRLTPSFNT